MPGRKVQIDETKLNNADRDAFYDSVFMAVEPNPLNSTPLSLSTLTGEIHPLSRESRWAELPADRTKGWFVIENSCRLASRLLESRALGSVWDTLLNQTAVEITPTASASGRSTRSSAKKSYRYRAADVNAYRKIPAQVITKNKARLRNLASQISLVLTEDYESGLATEGVDASKHGYADPSNPNSRESIICVSTNELARLLDAQQSRDLPQMLWLSFDLAVNLVHEVAHAVRKAVDGTLDSEPCWGNDPVAELGFQLEKALFGGCMANIYDDYKRVKLHRCSPTHDSKLPGMIVLWRWPCQAIADQYDQGKYPISMTKKPEEIHECDVAWRVDVAWLQQFFTDAFWTKAQHITPAHLRPPKDVGYNFRIRRKGQFGAAAKVPVRAPNDDWRYFSTNDHIRLDDGAIVRRSIIGTSRITGRLNRIVKSYRK